MFFFFFDKNDTSQKDNRGVNENIYRLRNRQDVLELEAKLLVLRLLQLRDSHKFDITSVKQDGIELCSPHSLNSIDLSKLSIAQIDSLASSIGYKFTRRIKGHPQTFSKVNIEINGKKYGIRCFDHTERPLINHSTREKYEQLCNKAGVSIERIDDAISSYWECREAGVFNEDCIYTSPLNPFINIKEDLRKLLTYIAFHSYDIRNNVKNSNFELEKLDGYIDYVNPCNEATWDVLNEEQFFDKVWKHLRFSLRADRGMPNRGKTYPKDESIQKWTRKWKNKDGEVVYKGALHIRISKYVTSVNETPFNELFTVKYAEEIKEVNINQGEKDEYLLKLFLLECKKHKRNLPIGNEIQTILSVQNSKREEIEYPEKKLDWNAVSPGLLVYVCKKIKAGKSGAYDKADVFVNGIGISVKSKRGAPPSIINQTTRDKILRIMNDVLKMSIEPLDKIVDRYWTLRLAKVCGEDVSGQGAQNPFTTESDGSSTLPIMKPLLNYFTFKGTGKCDSSAPAEYVLSMGNPEDPDTWIYYSESTFVDSVWNNLVFSIRGKGLPANITAEMKSWVKVVDGKKKGTLNVRVKKM